MENQELLNLIGKFLANDINDIEKQKLDALLQDNEEDQLLFEKMQKAWEVFGHMEPTYKPKSKEKWQAMLDKVEKSESLHSISNITTNNTESSNRKTLRLHPFKYAAAASVVLLLALGYSFFFGTKTEMLTRSTLASEKLNFQLPDGSEVWMNELSEIKYPEDFKGDIRDVYLNGEAFFKVQKNKDKPFIIYTNETKTQVLGTSFNVSANKDSDKVEVTVVTGKVSFARLDSPDKKVILNPGDKGVFMKKEVTLSKTINSNKNFLSWQNEKLVFEDTQLSEVFQTLSKYFNVKIEASNPKLLKCKFTSTFNNPDLDEILKVLSITIDMSYKKNGTLFTVSGKGCD